MRLLPLPHKGSEIQSPGAEIRKGLIQQSNSNTTNNNNNNNSNNNEQSKISTNTAVRIERWHNTHVNWLFCAAALWRQEVTSAWYMNNPARASPPLLGKLNPILAKPGQMPKKYLRVVSRITTGRFKSIELNLNAKIQAQTEWVICYATVDLILFHF